MSTIDLLGPDSTTVLWAFTDPTGANNGGVITKLAAGLDLGSPGEAVDLFSGTRDGAVRLQGRVEPVEMVIPFMASASTYSTLARGLGTLSKWLHDPVGYLRWTEDGTSLYITLLGCLSFPSLLRGQETAGIVALRKSSLGPLTVRLLRQPWMEGNELTSSTFTLPMDMLSSSKLKTFPVTIGGDLETPVKVRMQVSQASGATLTTSAAADDIIDTTTNPHPFEVGDAVQFTALTGGSGLAVGTTYYVIAANLAPTTLQISTTQGGSAVNFTTDITAGTLAYAGRVGKVVMGAISQGANPVSYAADRLSDTGGLDMNATNRNWTIALGGRTANSLGFAVTTFSSNPSTMLQEWQATRTTKVDSLRGNWRVWLRNKVGAASLGEDFYLQGKYGFSTTSSADRSMGDEVKITSDTTAPQTRPTLIPLGVMRIPTELTVPVTALRLEIWSRNSNDPAHGTGEVIQMRQLWFQALDDSGALVAPGSEKTTYLGSNLDNPSGITGDPGWTDGSAVGTAMRLNAANEAAGTLPTSGATRTVGTHRVTFTLRGNAFSGGTWKTRITNETDNLEVTAETVSAKTLGVTISTLTYEALGGKNYLYAAHVTAYGSGSLDVLSITDEVISSVPSGFYLETDPARVNAQVLDASANAVGSLEAEGSVVGFMKPGAGHIHIAALEVPPQGYDDFEDLEDRQVTCTEKHRDRYNL